jgi:hypothetical protein
MGLSDILAIALASLVTLVAAHIAVFWVVRTLYPPQVPAAVAVAPVVVPQTLTQAPLIEQQNVTLPTYETAVPVAPPVQEEPRRGPPPAVSTSIKRESGVDTPNA